MDDMTTSLPLHAPKVAVWGWYDAGNFGDDLMGLLVSKWLVSLGYRPMVFGHDRTIHNLGGATSTTSLDHLLDGAAICLVGGGGLFLRGAACETRAGELARAAEKFEVPIWLMSVGTDDESLIDWDCMPGRRQLLDSPMLVGGTLRTATHDPNLLKRSLSTHQDLVLTAGSRMRIGHQSVDVPTIGINLPTWGRGQELVKCLRAIAKTTRKFRLVGLQTAHSTMPNRQEMVGWLREQNIAVIQYETVPQFMNALASLDLVISFKLHVGVAALSCGVPFVGFGGSHKVRSFFRLLEASHLSFGCKRRDVAQLLFVLGRRLLSSRSQWQSLIPQGIGYSIDSADGHFSLANAAIQRILQSAPLFAR